MPHEVAQSTDSSSILLFRRASIEWPEVENIFDSLFNLHFDTGL